MVEAAAQPMFWFTWAKRGKLEMNFHFVQFDTNAQSAWLWWLVAPGVKRGGIAPQGSAIRTKRGALSRSGAVRQGRFRNDGY